MQYSFLIMIAISGMQISFASTAMNEAGTSFVYIPGRSKNVFLPTQNTSQTSSCKLCKATEENNPNELPLLRTQHFTVMLNLYPYGEGHLLIVANAHIKALDQLTLKQQTELISLISQSTTILKTELKCPGVNVGYNEGRYAGASVTDHFHMHVLPRYEFVEKSFVHAISNLQIVQWNLKELQQRLQPYFDAIQENFITQS